MSTTKTKRKEVNGMYKLSILLFDIVLFTQYFLIGFTILILVQLISYRIFNFNLYKKVKYILIDSQIKQEVKSMLENRMLVESEWNNENIDWDSYYEAEAEKADLAWEDDI